MRLSVSEPAADDLANIAAYIKLESIERAYAVIDRLERAIYGLLAMPTKGRRRDDLERGLRTWFEDPYIIAYRIDADCVRIIRVIHGRRDFSSLSFADLD